MFLASISVKPTNWVKDAVYMATATTIVSKETILLGKEIKMLGNKIIFLGKKIIFLGKKIKNLGKEIEMLGKEIVLSSNKTHPPQAFSTAWPPNSLRKAATTFPEKVSSTCER
jgi:hypothetical protein